VIVKGNDFTINHVSKNLKKWMYCIIKL